MSQLFKALNKVQESRQGYQDEKTNDLVYLSETSPVWLSSSLVILLVIGAFVAVVISSTAIVLTLRNSDSKQSELLGLEAAIKANEKQINDSVTVIKKNRAYVDNQIRATKTQIDHWALTDNEHYTSLKNSMLDDKDNINLLNKYINILNQNVKEISAKENHSKALPNPDMGN